MGRMLGWKAGPFFAWQAAALVVVFAVAASGAFMLGRSGGDGTSVRLGEGEQLVAVRVGNLIDSVSTSGTVAFANRETVMFDIAGEVAEVLVSEGDVVRKGQALARIDESTAIDLAAALAKAEANLRDAREEANAAANRPGAIAVAEAEAALARAELAEAEEALAEAMAGPDALETELLQAEAAAREQELSTAKANLGRATLTSPIGGVVKKMGMKEGGRAEEASALIEIVDPSVAGATIAFDVSGEVGAVFVRKGDIVTAGQTLAVIDDATQAALEKAAADAEVRARDAVEALALASGPSPVRTAKAEERIAQARLALRKAQEALDDLMEATPAETAELEVAVADATESLVNAGAELAAVNRDSAQEVAKATDAASDAEAAYAAIFRRWLGITITAAEMDTAPETLLAAWEVDLDALFTDQSALADARVIDPPDDDPETAWSEATIYSWLRLYPGAIVGTCDGEAPFQKLCAEKEMDDAWTALGEARSALTSAEVAASRKSLAAESAVDKAEDELTAAKKALADLLAPDPLDVAAAAADVALAQAELASAETALANVMDGGDTLEINRLRTELVVAEQALEDANARLARATLTAPVAGVVATVALSPGDQADEESALIEIADPAAASARRETVVFGFAGEIAEVFVSWGDVVSEGQTLARIDYATRTELEMAAASAEVKLRDARRSLQSKTEPDSMAVNKAAVNVNAARTKAANAEAALAEARTSADSVDNALVKTELAVAERALANAKSSLAGATLTSPIDGVVESVSMTVGEQTNRTGTPPAVDVVDLSVAEINGSMDEVDALAVSVGASARVSLTALGERTLEGEVVEIGSANSGQTGSVTFPITIRLSVPAGVTLREGLSATAEIVFAEHRNVLLTPTASVTGSILSPTARVVVDGVVEERAVKLGPSDDFWVVALEGLEEGDMVVMPEPASGGQFGAPEIIFEERQNQRPPPRQR